MTGTCMLAPLARFYLKEGLAMLLVTISNDANDFKDDKCKSHESSTWFRAYLMLVHGVCICGNGGQFEPRIHYTVILKKSLEVHLLLPPPHKMLKVEGHFSRCKTSAAAEAITTAAAAAAAQNVEGEDVGNSGMGSSDRALDGEFTRG